jgi:hypothetical protein
LQHGVADINPEDCDTVLQGACEKLRPESVKLLLGAGADVNKGEISALKIAINTRCPNDRVGDKIEIINMLLDAGASTRDCIDRKTVLHMPYTCWEQLADEPSYNLVAAYTAVLARDPGLVHCRDDRGATPLLSVARRHSAPPALIKVLIDAKADVNAVDAEGETACSLWSFELYGYCTPKSDKEANTRRCLQLLLAAGADPTLCNDGEKTLLMQLVDNHYNYGLPERGFEGAPAVLADVINAVAYRDVGSRDAGGRDSSPNPGAVWEVWEPGAGGEEGSEDGYKPRTGARIGSKAGKEILEEEKQSKQPRKRAKINK